MKKTATIVLRAGAVVHVNGVPVRLESQALADTSDGNAALLYEDVDDVIDYYEPPLRRTRTMGEKR